MKKIQQLDPRWIAVLLLLTSGVFVFVLPLLKTESPLLGILLISVIIFLAAYNISRRLILIGLIAIFIEVGTRTTDFKVLNYLAVVTTNLFLIYIVGNVVLDMMRQRSVTLFTLVEAVNGYLLMGIMFISLVAYCELTFPGAYLFKGEESIDLVYYTIVTLTTVGYGDIIPQIPIAKSLSMIIAISGQFYIAVVVAIIVGKFASKN
ncbi:potassium channel family protein [uncultured Eudoraea sp.]|uniref:potassium channel family protein n=1 Tax=uncultured Eudoraea sp. TaxID=1035614 RepID=UPI00262A2806|nr:potassium channel family protein [uncultured Eudoraea sp.]